MKYNFWKNEILQSPIAFDTETVFDKDINKKSPELVLAAAYDGKNRFIIDRANVSDFLNKHKDCEFIFHNVAFDFWVLIAWDNNLSSLLFNLVDNNKVHDTMLLDQLVRLAQGKGTKGGIPPRNLEEVSKEYCPLTPANKELGDADPYRYRYHELLNNPLFVDEGFYEYAISDVVATYYSYSKLWNLARNLINIFSLEKQYKKYGLLTENIQVKAAIALRKITMNGIGFNREYANKLEKEYRAEIAEDWKHLITKYPDLFSYDRKGKLKLTAKGAVPALSTKALKVVLEKIAFNFSIPPPQSKGKKGGISTSEKLWAPFVKQDPSNFLKSWCNVVRSRNLLKFFDIFRKEDSNRVHPSYIVIKNTGRTGSYNPNIQQTPRNSKFRSIYCASSNKKLLTIDYAAIELRTLAAVCYNKFGFSVLGDIINQGVDPHAYTAAMINSLPLTDFLALKKTDPIRFKNDRQNAKALNFGIPGGLGPKKLVEYAKTNYKVELTEEQAKEFRNKLIKNIYPELDLYLASTSLNDLSYNLKLKPQWLQAYIESNSGSAFDEYSYFLGRVARGELLKKDGKPYNKNRVHTAWEILNYLAATAGREDIKALMAAGRGSKELYMKFFGHSSVTLTGRIRGACDYTDGKNHPFQSLASDGGKLALWELIKSKKLVVAFIHDEILVELDSDEEANKVKKVMCEEMYNVLNRYLPVEVEYSVNESWSK